MPRHLHLVLLTNPGNRRVRQTPPSGLRFKFFKELTRLECATTSHLVFVTSPGSRRVRPTPPSGLRFKVLKTLTRLECAKPSPLGSSRLVGQPKRAERGQKEWQHATQLETLYHHELLHAEQGARAFGPRTGRLYKFLIYSEGGGFGHPLLPTHL